MKKLIFALFLAIILSGCVSVWQDMETWFYDDVMGTPLHRDERPDDTVIVEIEIDWGD